MHVRWYFKNWSALSLAHFHAIEHLRIAVFVVEQDCPYQDLDGKDLQSEHIYALDEQGRCMAYARLVEPGVSYAEPSIGRVATQIESRRTGLGKELMRVAIERQEEKYPSTGCRISAQCYLIPFYESFGFQKVGEEYLEDDIPHIQMFRS